MDTRKYASTFIKPDEVGKSKKFNNGGACLGVEVRERGDDKSTPLQPPGLSDRRIRDLAQWYENEGYARRGEDGSIDQTALDGSLRKALAQEVLPEFVEVEFARVIGVVFPRS